MMAQVCPNCKLHTKIHKSTQYAVFENSFYFETEGRDHSFIDTHHMYYRVGS